MKICRNTGQIWRNIGKKLSSAELVVLAFCNSIQDDCFEDDGTQRHISYDKSSLLTIIGQIYK